MVGPTLNLPKGWDLTQKEIRLDQPVGLQRYLGCDHLVGTIPASEVKENLERFQNGKGLGEVGTRAGGDEAQRVGHHDLHHGRIRAAMCGSIFGIV